MKRRSFLQVGMLAATDGGASHLSGSTPFYSALIDQQGRAALISPYPILRSERQTGIQIGDGGRIYGPFDGLQIFDIDDVAVFSREMGESSYKRTEVVVAKVSGLPFDFFTVEFATNIPATTTFIVFSDKAPERTTGIRLGETIDPPALEKELSILATTAQELKRDLARAVRSEFGEISLTIGIGLADGHTLVKSGDRLISGPSAVEVANAEMYAQAASAAANSINQRIFTTIANAEGVAVPPIVKRCQFQFRTSARVLGSGFYARRISLADLAPYPSLSYFRTIDRFMPDETEDDANGGYWVIDEMSPLPAMFGAYGDGIADDTAALNAYAAYISVGTVVSGEGLTASLVSGRFRITDTVQFKFGTNIRGPEGSSAYGCTFVVDPGWAGGDVAVLIKAETEAFTSAYIAGITVDCSGVSGLTGLRFEGAYQNSTLKNIQVIARAPDAIGLHVKPLDRAGAVSVCESLLIENVYVVRTSPSGSVTSPAILLDRCQETKLVNVKGFGRSLLDADTPVAAAIKLSDCRGISLDNCSGVSSRYGIEVEARRRQTTGITIVSPTYEAITEASLYIHGTAKKKVTNVTQIGTRAEAPFAALGLSAKHVDYLVADTAFQDVNLGHVSSASILGFGTVTADANCRYSQTILPNAILDKHLIRAVVAVIKASNPAIGLMVDGRGEGAWQWQWTATASADDGTHFSTPSGRTTMSMGETVENGAPRIGFFGTKHVEAKSGWETAIGTGDRASFSTYTAPTFSSSPTQEEMQGLADHVQVLSRHLKALIDDLHQNEGYGLLRS